MVVLSPWGDLVVQCDLDGLFADLARRVPEEDDSSFSFSAETFLPIPVSIGTDRIVIEKSYHQYDSFTRRDALHFHATKATYRNLALLVASVLFASDDREVTLSLAHPASAIRRIVVRSSAQRAASTAGLHFRPFVFNYHPSEVAKHPWHDRDIDPRDLPAFLLTNAEECVTQEWEWAERDTLIGFGSDAGSARLIESLLDASRSSSSVDEIELEGEEGFRGVAPFSCEVRLWLPGSFGWKEEFWHPGIRT